MSDKECTCYEFTDGHQAGCPMNRTGLTTDRIAEIRERASRATEGPWCVSDIAGDFILVLGNDDRYTAVPVLSDTLDPSVLDGPTLSKTSRKRNAEFLAHAREDIPYLLAQLDAARAEVERLRAEIPPRPDNADRLIWLLKATDAPPFSIGDDE